MGAILPEVKLFFAFGAAPVQGRWLKVFVKGG
jgi:hypothetical protein